MTVPAYSTRIYVGSINPSQAYVDVATVPAGHRLVVVQLNCNFVSGTGSTLLLTLKTPLYETLRVLQTSSSSVALWTGRICYHEGETLQLRVIGPTTAAGVYLGGYLFTGAGGPLMSGQLPAPP